MAIDGFGTLLKIGDGGGPEVFTTIAEVTDISGPKYSAKTLETTSHSTADRFRTFLPGLIDAGEVTADIQWDPNAASHGPTANGLVARIGTLRNFKLAFPTSPAQVATFSAVITNVEPKAPMDDLLTASVTLKISGKPTWATS